MNEEEKHKVTNYPPPCYSCGDEIQIDADGRLECYCNGCLPQDKGKEI